MSIYVGSSINKGIGGRGGSVVTTAKTSNNRGLKWQ